MLARATVLRRVASLQCRRLSTVGADVTLGAEKFFPPLTTPGTDKMKLKGDKEEFTLQFELLKAVVLGKSDAPAVKAVAGKGALRLAEGDIENLSAADKFLARRLRLQALKYRDYLMETGKLANFEKLTADQAWQQEQDTDSLTDPSSVTAFASGKLSEDSAQFQALPEWGKEVATWMKADEAFITGFKAKNPETAKNIEAALAQATTAQEAGGVMPTCSVAKDPATCLYTIEGTPEYDFQFHWYMQADMLARTPEYEYLLTVEDKAYCEAANAKLVESYRQFFGDGSITVPDKVVV